MDPNSNRGAGRTQPQFSCFPDNLSQAVATAVKTRNDNNGKEARRGSPPRLSRLPSPHTFRLGNERDSDWTNTTNTTSTSGAPSGSYCVPGSSSNTYENPRAYNGMAPPSINSSDHSGRSPVGSAGSSASEVLLGSNRNPEGPTMPQPAANRLRNAAAPSAGLHYGTEKLERCNRRLRNVFYVMVTLCCLAMVVYVFLIVALFLKLSSSSSSSPSSSPSMVEESDHSMLSGGLSETSDCVTESEIQEFKNIWDPEDDITNTLENTGFVYHSIERKYCFRSLEWVPKIMGKINSRVQASVKYIEDQQEKINQTVNSYTSANKTGSQCPQGSSRNPLYRDPTNPAYSVYAHYFVNSSADYQNNSNVQILKWLKEGQMLSSRNNVEVSSQSGNLTIKHSGFYFLYTQLVFRDDDKNKSSLKAHRVVRKRFGTDTKLLESVQRRVSFMQGVFQLHESDTLTVVATGHELDKSREKMSYFGLYLIRT